MKVATYLLVIIPCIVAMPAETPVKLGFQKLAPINLQVEPVNFDNTKNFELQPLIVGGVEVTPNSVPYQVGIIFNDVSLCGGSLISKNAVLTAAHCTSDASFAEVKLGAHHLYEEEPTQVRLTSTSFKIHADYNKLLLINDISIIFLPEVVELSDKINTVLLPQPGADTYEGKQGFLTGWGKTDTNELSPVLMGLHVEIMSNTACRNYFGGIISADHLCTSGEGYVGGCNGDSGSPLVVDGVQVGLTSFGFRSCYEGYPTAYVRTSSYRSWIEDITGI